MQDYAHNGDQLIEPCGSSPGPESTSPAAESHHLQRQLPIHVSARDSQGVGRITLKIDGKLIRNYTDQGFPHTLAGALRWHGAQHIPPGRHILSFFAVRQAPQHAERSIVIYHRAPHRKRHHRRRH